MTDRAINFTAPMVRALISGTKTQTRQVLKPQPLPVPGRWSGPHQDCETAEWGMVATEWRYSQSLGNYEPDRETFVPFKIARVGDRLSVVQFREIPFGDGKFAVGDDGNLYDVSGPLPRRRMVRLSHNGYEEITLRFRGAEKAFRISRLVAEAFYGPPAEGLVCRHLDGNRRNNKPENLDWGTPVENSADAAAAGSFTGPAGSQTKLSIDDVHAIRASSLPQAALAAQFGVTQPTISKIRSGKRWAEPGAMPARNCAITFSRLTLIVTDVRVQRLQDISEADAIAEGATCRPRCYGFNGLRDGWSMDWSQVGAHSRYAENGPGPLTERDVALVDPSSAFGSYVNELHGGPSWNLKPTDLWTENPWVAAVSFETHRCNIDAMPANPADPARAEMETANG